MSNKISSLIDRSNDIELPDGSQACQLELALVLFQIGWWFWFLLLFLGIEVAI